MDLASNLFGELHQAEVIDDDMIQEGFKGFVDFLDDTAIDVPNAYAYVACELQPLSRESCASVLTHACLLTALLVGAGLSKDKIEAMTESMEGEGDKTPKERFMEKVEALL